MHFSCTVDLNYRLLSNTVHPGQQASATCSYTLLFRTVLLPASSFLPSSFPPSFLASFLLLSPVLHLHRLVAVTDPKKAALVSVVQFSVTSSASSRKIWLTIFGWIALTRRNCKYRKLQVTQFLASTTGCFIRIYSYHTWTPILGRKFEHILATCCCI